MEIKTYNGSLYGAYRQNKLTDVWKNSDEFLSDMTNMEIPLKISNESTSTLYWLLYSKYGNDIIASSDTERFKYRVAALIFQYGPTWEARLSLQDKLRKLDDDELMKGTTAINNHASNPGSKPTTQTLEELTGIGEQVVTKYKKNKLEAYSNLYEVLKTDVTEYFLSKFDSLFLVNLQPELPLLYEGGEYEN